MMKKIVYIVLGCVLTVTSVCSCSQDTFSTEEEEQAASTPGNGVELPYQIAPFQTDGLTSRAVAPTTDETRINDITYLLFQFTGNSSGGTSDENMWECTGSYYQTNVGQSGETGKLSFQLPSSLDENSTYEVLAICNLASYCPTSLESFGLRLRGEKLSNVKANLTTTGIGKYTGDAKILETLRDFSSGDNMLMTGEFTFTPKQNVPLLTLNRKNVIYETNIKDLPADVTIEHLTIHKFPLQTYLFSENRGGEYATADLTIPASYIEGLGTTFKLYYLPTSTDKNDMVSIDLVYTLKQDKYTVTSSSGQTPSFALETVQSEKKTQTFQMRIGPETDNAGYYFAPNEYIRAVLFEAADKPNNMLMTLNGWLTGEYSGVYQLASDGTRGYSVSSDHLNFPFCRQEPMPSSQTTSFPDGSQSYEVFIAGHGVLPSWSIELKSGTSIPSWLTIQNHVSRSSIVVTVQPNFKIASDGSIISTPRLFDFNLKIGEATFPITVRQDAAPLYAGDVTLPNGLTVSGKYYGASTANYYNNVGYWNTPKYIGDENARGLFYNHTTWAKGSGTGKPTDEGFTSSQTSQSISELEKVICAGKSDFRLPTGKELAISIYPYIKYLKSNVDGKTADIFYLSSEKEICFIPLVGNYAGLNLSNFAFAGAANAPYSKLTGWYGKDTESGHSDGYTFNVTGKGDLKVLTYTGITLGGNSEAISNLFGGPVGDYSTEDPQYSTYMYRCVKGSVKTNTSK